MSQQNHCSDRKPLQINATGCAAIAADRMKDCFIKALKLLSVYLFYTETNNPELGYIFLKESKYANTKTILKCTLFTVCLEHFILMVQGKEFSTDHQRS